MNSIRSFDDVVGEGHVLQVVDAPLRVAADDTGQHIASLDPGLLGGAARAQQTGSTKRPYPVRAPQPIGLRGRISRRNIQYRRITVICNTS